MLLLPNQGKDLSMNKSITRKAWEIHIVILRILALFNSSHLVLSHRLISMKLKVTPAASFIKLM